MSRAWARPWARQVVKTLDLIPRVYPSEFLQVCRQARLHPACTLVFLFPGCRILLLAYCHAKEAGPAGLFQATVALSLCMDLCRPLCPCRSRLPLL